MSEECYVYVIGIPELGLSKIGISRNPNSRLKQLSTGSPFKMEIFISLATPSFEAASMLERGFHTVLGEHRKNGEWFNIEPYAACEMLVINFVCHLSKYWSKDRDRIEQMLVAIGADESYKITIDKISPYMWGEMQ